MPAPPAYSPHYRVLLDGLGLDAIDPAEPRTLVETAFLDFLIGEFARLLPFDAAFYEASNPDVAAALHRGELSDLHTHFILYGFREGRLPHPVPFDTEYYLQRYPDLAGHRLLDVGREGMRDHYERFGRREARAGHLDSQADSDRWWSASRRTPYRLGHRSMAGAMVQAFRDPLPGGPPLGFRGGVVLGDAPADLRLRHRRGGVAVDSFPPSGEPVGALAGEHVYGGPYYNHFGHTMAEMVHRILPAREVFGCRRLLFVGVGVDHATAGFDVLPAVTQAALRFLEVDPADVTVIHDDRAVEMLHVVQQGSDLTGGPTAPYLDMLAAFTPARLEALRDDGPAARRLYVSRSRIAHGGTVLGERYLEKLLRAEGWTIFHPQEFTLVEQMQAYDRAETVLFAEGSAVHGVELFGRGGLGHCVLLPRRHDHRWIFENALKQRCRRFDMLPSATLLGTVAAGLETGMALEHLGVSLLDLPVLARSLRDLGLARLPGLDPPAYRRAARADLAAYVGFYRRPGGGAALGARLAGETEVAAFEGRCVAAMGAAE